MNEMRKLMETIDAINEGKWDYEKRDKGKGAGTDSPMYDGGAKNRKSRKAFRKAEKAKAHKARMRGEISEYTEILGEGATSEQWEIAINNLIGQGDERFMVAGATIEEKNTWQWVSSELHGMLDFQPDNDVSTPDRWAGEQR